MLTSCDMSAKKKMMAECCRQTTEIFPFLRSTNRLIVDVFFSFLLLKNCFFVFGQREGKNSRPQLDKKLGVQPKAEELRLPLASLRSSVLIKFSLH